MARGWMIVALVAALSGCGKENGPAPRVGAAAPVDIAGVWLPDATRAEPWPAQLPLTPAALSMMENFNPAEHDPISFCMPLGTPRNEQPV